MDGEPFTMTLTDTDEIKAVIAAVNVGIDGHLEACFCPDRGDRYEGGDRKAGKLVLCHCLDCSISPESLPVLLRRLSVGPGDRKQKGWNSIRRRHFDGVGINEYGTFVGREALV